MGTYVIPLTAVNRIREYGPTPAFFISMGGHVYHSSAGAREEGGLWTPSL